MFFFLFQALQLTEIFPRDWRLNSQNDGQLSSQPATVHNIKNISQKSEWTKAMMISTSQDVESQLCSGQELNMKNLDEEMKKQKQHQVYNTLPLLECLMSSLNCDCPGDAGRLLRDHFHGHHLHHSIRHSRCQGIISSASFIRSKKIWRRPR